MVARRPEIWPGLNDDPAAFRPGRRTAAQTVILQALSEHPALRKRFIHVAFIDFSNACNTVNQGLFLKFYRAKLLPSPCLGTSEIFTKMVIRVRWNGVSSNYSVRTGVPQDNPCSGTIFNIYLDDPSEKSAQNRKTTIRLGYNQAYILKYADDVLLIADSELEFTRRCSRFLRSAVPSNRLPKMFYHGHARQ